jgi:hypothetical protein
MSSTQKASTTTTFGAEYGHPEFLLEYNEEQVSATALALLERKLTTAVRAGVEIKEDGFLPVGIMICRTRFEAGRWVLLEPDMVSTPMQFVRSVTTTALFLAQQESVLGSLGRRRGVVADSPLMLDSALICTEIDHGLGVLERQKSNLRDTGWFVGCDRIGHDHNDPNSLLRVSVYDLVRRVPAVVPYLPLWAGTTIRFAGKSARSMIFDPALQIELKSGSPLDVAGFIVSNSDERTIPS